MTLLIKHTFYSQFQLQRDMHSSVLTAQRKHLESRRVLLLLKLHGWLNFKQRQKRAILNLKMMHATLSTALTSKDKISKS